MHEMNLLGQTITSGDVPERSARPAPAEDAGASPLFSVVIPTYRRPAMVKRAVESVLRQTERDFEVLVVDDASGDETPAVVAAVADPRVRYLCREVNGGAGACRNDGVAAARGEFVSFLDDDDEYLPEFLALTRATLEGSGAEVGLSWSGIRWIRRTQQGDVLEREERWEPRYASREQAYLAFLANRHVGTNCGLTVKRATFLRLGGFDVSLRNAQDTDFLIRAVREYDFRVVPGNLVLGILHGGPSLRGALERKLHSYETIIAKHADTLATHPHIAAKLHYKAGWVAFHARRREVGRRHFRAAAARNPWMGKLWTSWALLELPGGVGPRLHRWISEKRRGHKSLS